MPASCRALIDGLHTELGDWIADWNLVDTPTARTIAAIGVDALIGHRAAHILFSAAETPTTDPHYLTEWTTLIATRIQTAEASAP